MGVVKQRAVGRGNSRALPNHQASRSGSGIHAMEPSRAVKRGWQQRGMVGWRSGAGVKVRHLTTMSHGINVQEVTNSR